jgi:Flp pilus assembly protein TadD
MSDAESVLGRALQMGDEGDWEGMARTLAEGLDDNPDDAYLLVWLGTAERQLGNEGAAYERFKQALATGPDDPRLLAIAGTGLAAFDDPEAEGVLRTAAMLGPETSDARLAYGSYLAREGFLDQALTELKAARELAPDDATVWVETGVALALKGEMDGAADAFERGSRSNGPDAWARILLGLVLLELDRLEEATSELVAAARSEPHDPEAQLLAALSAAATGWDDLAAEMLERSRQSAVGADLTAVLEADERIEDGPESAREFLLDAVAPDALHRRLRARP